jgi:hypothetical protein
MKAHSILAGAVLAAVAMAGSAQAGTVTETYDFTLGGFVDIINSSAAPITSVSGSFTLTFDPSLTIDTQTTNITGSISGIPGAPVVDSAFAFSTSQGPPYDIEIGGAAGGAGLVYEFTNDFVLSLQFPTGNLGAPVLGLCAAPGFICGNYTGSATVLASGYSEADTSSVWFATAGSSTFVSATPLPATWTMLIAGFVGLGFFAYRGTKNRSATIAA